MTAALRLPGEDFMKPNLFYRAWHIASGNLHHFFLKILCENVKLNYKCNPTLRYDILESAFKIHLNGKINSRAIYKFLAIERLKR